MSAISPANLSASEQASWKRWLVEAQVFRGKMAAQAFQMLAAAKFAARPCLVPKRPGPVSKQEDKFPLPKKG